MLLFRFHKNSPRNGLLTNCHTTLRGRRVVAPCLLALLWPSAQLGAQPNPPAGLTFGLPERISLAPNGADPMRLPFRYRYRRTGVTCFTRHVLGAYCPACRPVRSPIPAPSLLFGSGMYLIGKLKR